MTDSSPHFYIPTFRTTTTIGTIKTKNLELKVIYFFIVLASYKAVPGSLWRAVHSSVLSLMCSAAAFAALSARCIRLRILMMPHATYNMQHSRNYPQAGKPFILTWKLVIWGPIHEGREVGQKKKNHKTKAHQCQCKKKAHNGHKQQWSVFLMLVVAVVDCFGDGNDGGIICGDWTINMKKFLQIYFFNKIKYINITQVLFILFLLRRFFLRRSANINHKYEVRVRKIHR